jgi:hypothetical protein
MLTLLSVLDGPDHPGLVLDLDVTTSVWVVDADQIVVMDSGRVVATGRHDQLLETCRALPGAGHPPVARPGRLAGLTRAHQPPAIGVAPPGT